MKPKFAFPSAPGFSRRDSRFAFAKVHKTGGEEKTRLLASDLASFLSSDDFGLGAADSERSCIICIGSTGEVKIRKNPKWRRFCLRVRGEETN